MTFTQSVEQVIEQIKALYLRFGTQEYAEKCTQLQHAEQCGTFALEQGLDEEMALAAFIHDIGHFIAEQAQQEGFDQFGYFKHSEVGADFLRNQGFNERLVRLVAFHVQAKRYLAATVPDYMESLSYASEQTLLQQGGPMTLLQASAFEQQPDFVDLLKLRELDDLGKLEHKAVKPLSYWLELAQQHLQNCRSARYD